MSNLREWARAIAEVGLVPVDRVKGLIAVCQASFPPSDQQNTSEATITTGLAIFWLLTYCMHGTCPLGYVQATF